MVLTHFHLFVANAGGLAEANDQSRSNGTGSQTSLLTTTRNDGVDSDSGTSAHVTCADTHRSVNLVS